MLGPSSSALISLGARFPPCMKNVTDFPPTTIVPCLNNTANPVTERCSLEDVCAFDGFGADGVPDHSCTALKCQLNSSQFHHAHLPPCRTYSFPPQHACTADGVSPSRAGNGFSSVLCFVFCCWDLRVGAIKRIRVFKSANTPFRNVLGANFALVASPSVGASGAIFGTVAVSIRPVIYSFHR